MKAADAGVERAKSLMSIVGALVKAELRAGADSARARAEVAAADTQRIQARQALALARASLAQLLGAPVDQVDAGKLLRCPGGLAPSIPHPPIPPGPA